MKANYNHMNRMNRSNKASQQVRRTTIRTVRINRNRMELKPDEPPDIRRVLEQLNQQIRGNTEPKIQTRTIADLLENDEDAVEGETYEISSQCELNDFIEYVNGKRNTTGVTFKLNPLENGEAYNVTQIIAPITLTSDDDTNSPVPVANSVCFNGTLDGGYVLKGEVQTRSVTIKISIDESATTATTLHAVGLFGAIGVNGTIQNLALSGTVNAGANAGAVGALAGYNSGIINNVATETKVSASNSYNVGGIVGFNDAFYEAFARGTIRNSENSGAVTGYEKVGGICGENSGLIGSCSNSGVVRAVSNRRSGVGGIAGRNGNNNTALEKGQIFDCYNTGTITGGTGTSVEVEAEQKKLGQWVGGITGFQNSLSECGYCYNVGELMGYNRVHSIIGENDHYTTEEQEDGTLEKIYLGVKNCYGLETKVESVEVQEETDGSTNQSTSEMKSMAFLNLLNAGGVYWTRSDSENDGFPTLTNSYGVELTGSGVTGRPGFTTVYLDDYDGEKIPGNGKDSEYPFHNLADAVEAAGAGGKVILTKPITINQATGLYDSVTFERGFALTTEDPNKDGNPEKNAMFIIDVGNVTENGKTALGYLTMTTATIDGNGGGFLFYVKHGRLRLRGKITLRNCATAVYVKYTEQADAQDDEQNDLNRAQVEVNYATIDATYRDGKGDITSTNTAINLANANSDFILDAFNEVSIQGTIYLGTGSYITVGAAIPCELTVESEDTDFDTLIAKGIDEGDKKYALTQKDLNMLDFPDGILEWYESENEIRILL